MIQGAFYAYLKSLENSALNGGMLVISKDKQDALSAADVAEFLGFKTFVLADFRACFGDDLRSYNDELMEIFSTLRDFYKCREKKILISPLYSILHKLPKKEFLQSLLLKAEDELNLAEFKNTLLCFGYEFVDLVELSGEVSIRGDVIDIFTNKPYRITLFGDLIESIREFNPQTQMCQKEELESLEIVPAFLSLNSDEIAILEREISENIKDSLEFGNQIISYGFWFLDKINASVDFLQKPFVLLNGVTNSAKEILEFSEQDSTRLDLILKAKTIESSAFSDFNFNFTSLLKTLELHNNKQIHIIAKTEAQVRAAGILLDSNYHFHLNSNLCVNLLGKDILIISLNSPQKSKKPQKAKIFLDELKAGDFVVHCDYGVAIFSGITQANIFGATRDFIELKYLGDDKLLLPVENLDRIDRYIADGGIPLLDRLGKGSFAKLKEKVREKLFIIANAIIEMAAKRELIDGVVLDCAKEEILIFQNKSGFVYTDDQLQAVKEIFKDLSSGRVMDRLLSGDVGFGKTEVAMNAMFACFLNGFQSALIAPTTLLTYQHFNTLQERFAPFGLKLARLDRFCTAKEKKAVLDGLKSGEIHAVVGTHALLNAAFKNLALIIIDEEHKFGVKQKEKIKELAQNTHLLSMSATPIPRTLNMALSQIKGLSELKIPPSERQATRTFVKLQDSTLLKEVILRELRRGGQVFYIHNNIASIEQKKRALLEILPSLKIAILHSKIPQDETEEIMLEFAKGEYQMLLSTSIVESGIHLPNANTILIDSANCFGVADLHQLRGRVGRGNKEGFCYLLVDSFETLSDDAKKRLFALEKNSYLGSGGALAYHDLEIRGGGNLLGEAQSGHIKGVGYSLYLRMLEDAIFSLSGNVDKKEQSVDVKLSVTAFLNPQLIESERLRLELYRRLCKCGEEKEVFLIESEIEERFGRLDIYTRQFLDLIRIKILCKNSGIASVLNYEQNITLISTSGEKRIIKANSKDEDDILKAVFEKLKAES